MHCLWYCYFQCKYTAFGSSELCKSESHRLKIVNTFKRFFKCGHCSNRTMTLGLVVPLEPCRNCGMSQWERAPMLKVGSIFWELCCWRWDVTLWLTFRRSVVPSCPWSSNARRILPVLGLEGEGIMVLQNVKNHVSYRTASHHTRLESSCNVFIMLSVAVCDCLTLCHWFMALVLHMIRFS